MNRDYSDIIDLPHHVSTRHAHLPMESRAAQFSPFAALTGYGEAIEETARLTDTRSELDDSRKAELDETLRLLLPFLPGAFCLLMSLQIEPVFRSLTEEQEDENADAWYNE